MTDRFVSKYDGAFIEDKTNNRTYCCDAQKDWLDICDLLNELHNENKQLKSVINDVLEILEEADLFSSNVLEHDIKAYRELKGMDNKDAYTIATATKKAIKKLKEAIK